MALTFTDLITIALNNLPLDGDFATIMPESRWLFFDYLMNENNQVMARGKEDEFIIAYRIGDSTKWVKPGAIRNPVMKQYFVPGHQPLVTTYYQVTYTEHEMQVAGALVQNGGAALVDVIESKQKLEALGHYLALERGMFDLPVLTGDHLTMHGLPYDLVTITAAQVGGTGVTAGAFQGENPIALATGAAGTNWCGIDRSVVTATYAALDNWNFHWAAAAAANVEMTDTNKERLARALRHLFFVGPMDVRDLVKEPYTRFRMVTDEFIVMAMDRARNEQNDQVGADLTGMGATGLRIGKTNTGVLVNGLPVEWTPELDDPNGVMGLTAAGADVLNYEVRGYHPIYGQNLHHWKFTYRPGMKLHRRGPAVDKVHQPDVVVEYTDTIANIRVKDPQKCGFSGAWVVAE